MTEQIHFHFSLSCIGEGNATPFSILAWRIPGMGEPGGLPSMGSHRVRSSVHWEALPSPPTVPTCVTGVQTCALPISWAVAYQAPLSMEFSRQEYWNGYPFPSLGDLPNPGIELEPPALQANSLLSEQPGRPVNS